MSILIRRACILALCIVGAPTMAAAQVEPTETCKPGQFPVTCPTLYGYGQATTQFDIAKAIGLPGRVARMHYAVLAPGGVISQHSHKNRPSIEYILEGAATETKQDGSGKVVVRVVKKNEVELEPSDFTHWWKNTSKKTVRMIAVDIFQDSSPTFCVCSAGARKTEFKPPAMADKVQIEELGEIALATEYPDIPAMKNYVMRSRRVTLLPHQSTAVESSNGRPGYTYVVKGSPLENRSDREPSILRPEEFSITQGDTSYFWENPTGEPVVLWVVVFEPRTPPAQHAQSSN